MSNARSIVHGAFLLALVAFFTIGSAHAQIPVITDVSPEAAGPGDVIKVKGTGLGLATHLRFTANVGGFVGTLFFIVPVSTASATEVTGVVPLVNAFTPPNATPPGMPVGDVVVRDAGGIFSNVLPFYFMEGSNGLVASLGQGTTLSNGGKAATSFTISGGEPATPNFSFVLTLENAVPGALALLAFGSPVASPFLPVGDGLVAIDIALPLNILQPFITDANGEVNFAAPIPPGFTGLSFALQWALVDPGTGNAALAKGMVINF